MGNPTVIRLETPQIMASLPVDERINPGNGGIVFTTAHPDVFGDQVPAYRDPSHLAAWLYGFAAANELAIRADEDAKKEIN